MSTIIEFPVEKTRRVLSLRRQESRRLLFTSSLFSVLFVALFAQIRLEKSNHDVALMVRNERVGTSSGPERAIASVNDGDISSMRDREWEKKLAAHINALDLRKPASIGSDCVGAVCILGPSYRIGYDQGVVSAVFPDELSAEGIQALPSSDLPQLLSGMRGQAIVDYDSFELSSLRTPASLSVDGMKDWQTFELRKDGRVQGYAVVQQSADQIKGISFCSGSEFETDLSSCMKAFE